VYVVATVCIVAVVRGSQCNNIVMSLGTKQHSVDIPTSDFFGHVWLQSDYS
jgi:hypothetical protein